MTGWSRRLPRTQTKNPSLRLSEGHLQMERLDLRSGPFTQTIVIIRARESVSGSAYNHDHGADPTTQVTAGKGSTGAFRLNGRPVSLRKQILACHLSHGMHLKDYNNVFANG